jgi:hypothetical protein
MGRKFGRTQPPRPPPGPPASLKAGAAAVLKAATKLFDRQDGEGVEKRLLASILFTAAFNVLDRITDAEQRKALARRVHEGAYNRMVGNEAEDFQAGSVGLNLGRDADPSPGADLKAPSLDLVVDRTN